MIDYTTPVAAEVAHRFPFTEPIGEIPPNFAAATGPFYTRCDQYVRTRFDAFVLADTDRIITCIACWACLVRKGS